MTVSLTRSADRAFDFYGACPRALADPCLKQQLQQDIEDAGFTLVMPPQFHRFEGGGNGISFLAMLMESHVAIHTAPENGSCLEITIHTCEVAGVAAARTPAEKTRLLRQRFLDRFLPQHVIDYEDRFRADRHAELSPAQAPRIRKAV